MRVGIIGCGLIAEYHAHAGILQPGCQVVACADTNFDKARDFSERFEVGRVFASGDALLTCDEVDAVVVCTPPKWHAEFVLQALERGKHVLVEKPLATSLEQADAMVLAASHTDRIVGSALMHRYLPAYQNARDLIAKGILGEPQRVRMSLGRSMIGDSRFAIPGEDSRRWLVDVEIAGGGILMSSSIHFLSVVSYLFGDPVASSVSSVVRQLHPAAFPGIEDDVELRVQWANGVEFKHRESWVADLPYQAEIIGDDGRVSITGPSFTHLSLRVDARHQLPAPYATFERNPPSSSPPLYAQQQPQAMFCGLWADFVQSIREGAPVGRLPDVRHARNMQAIVAAAYEAASTGAGAKVSWMPKESAVPLQS